jgi:hypothetical protein
VNDSGVRLGYSHGSRSRHCPQRRATHTLSM